MLFEAGAQQFDEFDGQGAAALRHVDVGGQDDAAARFDDAPELGQGFVGFGQQMDDVAGHGGVEFGIGVGEAGDVGLLERDVGVLLELFGGLAQHAFGEVLEGAAQKDTYKKVPANSFIVEFTDEFMQEQEDGEYPLEIFNGSEYWPMIVVIKDHKFVEIKTMPEEEAPEWTLDEYNAWVEKVKADGQEVKEYTLGCPER